jgi:hypothetical protein
MMPPWSKAEAAKWLDLAARQQGHADAKAMFKK